MSKTKGPISQFLFIEDGSVDADDLIKTLKKRNHDITVVVYRQGARVPQLVQIAPQDDDDKPAAKCGF